MESPQQQCQSPEMDSQGNEVILSLERKSVQPFRSQDEYMYAMKEDLAEWFNTLYQLAITVESFFEHLETGVLLCQHANEVHTLASQWLAEHCHSNPLNGTTGPFQPPNGTSYTSCTSPTNRNLPPFLPNSRVTYRSNARALSFQARDNISNFISWCRGLGIKEVLLFESDDLVMRKNERSVVLCLLEVARIGAKYGMLAPQLVVLEQEIDREMARDQQEEEEELEERPPSPPQPWVQIKTCDLMSLDEMVREILGICTCPSQFPMIRVSEGKYRIGDSKQLIFVRILRNHVMVRVGGGWDTLEHFLDKHDPCRCGNKGHRGSRGTTPIKSDLRRRGGSVTPPTGGLATMELKTKNVSYESPARKTSHHNVSQGFSGTNSLPRGANLSSYYNTQKGYKSDDELDNDLPRRQRPQSAKPGGRTPSSVSQKNDSEGPPKRQRPQSARPGGRSNNTNTPSGLPMRAGSNTNLAFQNSADSTDGRPASADGRRTPTSLPSTPTVRRKLSYNPGQRQTPVHEESRSRVHQRSTTEPDKSVRSRSVGPSNNRKPLSLAPTSNTFQNNTINLNSGNKQEVFMISRDDAGKHKVTSQNATNSLGRPPKSSLPQRPISAKTRREVSMERSRTFDENELQSKTETNHTSKTTVTADKVLKQVEKEVENKPRKRRNSETNFSLNNKFEDYPDAPPEDRKLNAEMEKMFAEYRQWELGLKKRDEEEIVKMEILEKAKLERQGSNSSSSSDTQNKVGLERQMSNTSTSENQQSKVNGTTHVPKIMNPRDRRLNSSDSETSLQGQQTKNVFLGGENNQKQGNIVHQRQTSGSSSSSLDSRSSGDNEIPKMNKTNLTKGRTLPVSPSAGRKPIIRSTSQSSESMQVAPPSPSPIRKMNMQIDQVLPNTLATNKLSKRQEDQNKSVASDDNGNSTVSLVTKSNPVQDTQESCQTTTKTDNVKKDIGSFELVHYQSPAESSSDETGSRCSLTDTKQSTASRVRPSSANTGLASTPSLSGSKTPRRGSLRTLPKTPDEPAYRKQRQVTPQSSGRTRPITPEPTGRVRPTTPEPSRRMRPTTPDPSRQRPPTTPEITRRRPASANPAGRSRPTVPTSSSERSRTLTSQDRKINSNTKQTTSVKARSASSTRHKPGSNTNMIIDTPKPKPLKSHMRSHSTTLLFPEQQETGNNKTAEFTVYKEPKRPEKIEQNTPNMYPKFRRDDKEGPRTKIPMPFSDYNRQTLGEGATLRRVDSGVDITSSMSPTDTLRSDSDVMWSVPQEAVGYKAQTIIAYQSYDHDDDDTQYF